MVYVGKIDRELFIRIANDIITDEVIITDDRIQHIIDRRGQAFFDEFYPHFAEILSTPDYIFSDERENTALVCKSFETRNSTVNLVLRLTVEREGTDYKNSVITAIRENDKRFAQRLRNHEPVYKRIDKQK